MRNKTENPPKGGELVSLYSFNTKIKIKTNISKCKFYALCKISSRNGYILVFTEHQRTDTVYCTIHHIVQYTNSDYEKVENHFALTMCHRMFLV